MSRFFALSLVVALFAGCPAREVSKVDPNQEKAERVEIPVSMNRDIDILFVIDNSGSMQGEQTSLTNNFQRFINVLESIEGGLPNVHIGVISTDVGVGGFNITGCTGNGDNGRLQNVLRSGCPAGVNLQGFFISDVEDPNCMDPNPQNCRVRNYTGTLTDVFSCIARLGTQGCGFEQPLESMKRALDGTNNENGPFLRPNAFLAVIIISDEDDCSAQDSTVFDPSQTNVSDPLGPLSSFRCFEFGIECDGGTIARSPASYNVCEPRGDSYLHHPDFYAEFLKGLKSNSRDIIVAGIIGNRDPVQVGVDSNGNPEMLPSCCLTPQCNQNEFAVPSVRLSHFVESFPNRNTFTSICQEDLSDALTQVASLLARVIGTPCLQGKVKDVDPDAPGIQVDCQVSDVVRPGEPDQQEFPIRRCELDGSGNPVGGQELPCWYVRDDAMNCAQYPTQLSLVVERNADPPPDTSIVAYCVVE